MRSRLLIGSAALHAGVACGLGLWVGVGALAERRRPAVLAFDPQRAATAAEPLEPTPIDPAPAEVEVSPDPRVRVMETFVPPDTACFEPPSPGVDPEVLPDEGAEPLPPADLFARVRPVEAAQPPEDVAEAAPEDRAQPETAVPPTPVSSFVAARFLDGVNLPPVYPPMSVRRFEEGVVKIDVAITAAGSVASVTLAKPSYHARLNRAAVDAARVWRFEPAQREGVAVAVHREFEIATDRGRARVH